MKKAESKTKVEAKTEDRRGPERIRLDRPIRLQFPDFRDFISAVTGNISEKGMFIRTEAVRAVGSQFRFELTLADGFSLIEGTVEVVWLHIQEKNGGKTGIGVRFLSLDGESAELVTRIVAEHRKEVIDD